MDPSHTWEGRDPFCEERERGEREKGVAVHERGRKTRFSLLAIDPRFFTFPDRVLGLAALNSSGNLGLGTF